MRYGFLGPCWGRPIQKLDADFQAHQTNFVRTKNLDLTFHSPSERLGVLFRTFEYTALPGIVSGREMQSGFRGASQCA